MKALLGKRAVFVVLAVAAVLGALLFLPLSGMAALVEVPVTSAYYTGTRLGSDASQVIAAGHMGDSGNFQLDWTITPESGGFDYKYDLTFGADVGGFSHLLLQTSAADVFVIQNLSTTPTGGGYLGPAIWIAQQGNPNLPVSNLYGIKISPDQSGYRSFTVEFFSPNIPVWGDFYAKDGVTHAHEEDNTVYNAGFGNQPVSDFAGWIPVPDSTKVPIPPSALLLGSGLLGLGLLSWRRKRS
jgi:hypothetical protein